MNHQEQSELSGKTVKVAEWVRHPQNDKFGGGDIHIEDWWDRVSGSSWMTAQGNPACLVYAMRTGFSDVSIPTDDEVLYGHTDDGMGHLIHLSEIS